MFKHMLILALSLGLIEYARSVCNVCQENSRVACISEKEFYVCANGIPDNSTKFSCFGEDEVCTHFSNPCKSAVDIKPSCGDVSNCGICEEEHLGIFTCTGRTTYSMCDKGVLSDFRIQCPENQICDVQIGLKGEFPCVPSCKEPSITTCDYEEKIEEPEVTTVEPITSTTTELSTTQTTEEIPISTTTEAIETSTPKVTKPPITSSSTTTTTEKISTTTEEITTTTIFSPTPPPVSTTTQETITTTTEIPTTTTQNPAELVCSQQTAAGRYPYPNDATCKNYIYCYKKGGVMQTTFMQCPGDFYFNPATTLCGSFKPQGCI